MAQRNHDWIECSPYHHQMRWRDVREVLDFWPATKKHGDKWRWRGKTYVAGEDGAPMSVETFVEKVAQPEVEEIRVVQAGEGALVDWGDTG